ncbi:general secretion pathway protein G [Kaistia hirudinis]|uniref:General secretion pathway protein G n=2 Tax=Kaistia hirudinis TaxID=1293440 RepID=A0A840AKB9_9HYPH|nr:general secretion pathway protein G [Kaistia hirudinis]
MTLLEILIVMVILGLLATLGSVQLIGYLGRAKAQTAHLQIEEIGTAVELYRIDVGSLPEGKDALIGLVEQPAGVERWNGPYLRKRTVLTDPWGRAYTYSQPGEHGEFDIVSLGADGKAGGEGVDADIGNWMR